MKTEKMEKMEKKEIVLVPINDIRPHENNPRIHPEKQIQVLVNSIKKFGFKGSILIDKDNYIVTGHARHEAALIAGLEFMPCEYADNMTEKDIAAYRYIDNKIAEMSSDDVGKLDRYLELLPNYNWDEFGIDLNSADNLVEDHKEEWTDMPEFEQPDATAFRTIKVHFNDQQSVDEFSRIIYQKFTDKTKFIWFPEHEDAIVKDVRYTGESA